MSDSNDRKSYISCQSKFMRNLMVSHDLNAKQLYWFSAAAALCGIGIKFVKYHNTRGKFTDNVNYSLAE